MQTLQRRIQVIEDELEKSEERLRVTTLKLAEAHQAQEESDHIRKSLENKTSQEDDKITMLEEQLIQARKIAEESDKKYEEVRLKYFQQFVQSNKTAQNSDQIPCDTVNCDSSTTNIPNDISLPNINKTS